MISAPLKFFSINLSKVHRKLIWDIWEYIPFRRCSAWLLLMVSKAHAMAFCGRRHKFVPCSNHNRRVSMYWRSTNVAQLFLELFSRFSFLQMFTFLWFLFPFSFLLCDKSIQEVFCSNTESVFLLDARRWFAQKAENNLFKQKKWLFTLLLKLWTGTQFASNSQQKSFWLGSLLILN